MPIRAVRTPTIFRAALLAGCVAAAMASGECRATIPGIVSLGVLPGDIASQVMGISSDGTTVVGMSNSRAFRWTAADGMHDLGGLAGSTSVSARAASADGSVVIGYCDTPSGRRMFRWTAGGGMVDVGIGSGFNNLTALATSADGNVIVGGIGVGSGNFRWTPGTGAVEVSPSHGASGGARGVSADGSVLVGSGGGGGLAPFLLTTSGTTVFLQGVGPGVREPSGISGNGLVAFGSASGSIPTQAVRWNAAGQVEPLGQLNGNSTTAQASTADGSVIVGFASSTGAFIWTQTAGMQTLAAYLASQGVSTTGWQLQFASGISADGRTIAGTGLYNGQTRGYIATIPSPPAALTAAAMCAAGSLITGRRRRMEQRSILPLREAPSRP